MVVQFADGGPAVTEKKVGKGKVIGLHFGVDAEVVMIAPGDEQIMPMGGK